MNDPTVLAAVDLGSNSFRLEIGRLDHGQIRSIEYLKETVRQGSGLDADRNLSDEAMQRGWQCLARFSERLAGFRKRQVRAVATQTMREARNRDVFLKKAHEILGFPIDVISGHEEARLIYGGVAHGLPQSDERRLVVDIGGRSTELILGAGYLPREMASFRVGSVASSMRFFPQGEFTDAAFAAAQVAASAVFDEAQHTFRRSQWDAVYGSSGTAGAVADVLALTGRPPGRIDRDGLAWLKRSLLAARSADRVRIEGIRDDRKAVIGGGVAVLTAVFDLLEIDHMEAATGALRHGVLYDLIDREHDATDVRGLSVERLARRFGVDRDQARRVAAVASHLWEQLPPIGTDAQRQLRKLGWAAQLHEIGSIVSHADQHKHGAYIIDNVDAAGFAQPELHRLSQLVLGHRGKLKKLDLDFDDEACVRQLLCLRLAVILCHARREPDLAGLRFEQTARRFDLRMRRDWRAAYPQSAYLLSEESQAWQKTPWRFEFGEALQALGVGSK